MRGVDWIESHLDGDLAPVLAPRECLPARSHVARRGTKIARKMRRMRAPKTLRNQHFDLLVDQFFALVAEQLFDMGINQENAALLIHEQGAAG